MSDVDDVIEAFVDGEPVDPASLKTALADAAGRDLLVDLLVLRGLVAGQWAARPAASAAPRSRGSRLWLAAAAATVAAFGVLGGYVAGSHRVANPVTGPAALTAAPAPAPTHVFRLENGVDWNERVGG
jgi:hypothetical protein